MHNQPSGSPIPKFVSAFSGGRIIAQARPSAGRGKNPSAEGGKSAEVSTGGDGKALTISYSATGSKLDSAGEDLEEAGEKLQDAGELIVESVSEVGDGIQEEASAAGKEVRLRVVEI